MKIAETLRRTAAAARTKEVETAKGSKEYEAMLHECRKFADRGEMSAAFSMGWIKNYPVRAYEKAFVDDGFKVLCLPQGIDVRWD